MLTKMLMPGRSHLPLQFALARTLAFAFAFAFALGIICLSSASSRAEDHSAPGTTPGGTPEAIETHSVPSPFQAEATTVRVLSPKAMDDSKRYSVLYILPVVAQDAEKKSDGLREIEKANVHNKHNLICVAPGFTSAPWYADHATNRARRDESHFLNVVLPFVEKLYPVMTNAESRLLIGFSKSGRGAFSLLLRHPHLFQRAAGFDPGIRIDTGPMEEDERKDRIEALFGSSRVFERHRIPNLLQSRGTDLGPEPRLFLISTQGRRATGSAQLHQLMVKLDIPHRYAFEPKLAHRWDSGWLPQAIEFLVR